MCKPERATVDVSKLPTVVLGERNLPWWGTFGFAVIESVTMILSFLTVADSTSRCNAFGKNGGRGAEAKSFPRTHVELSGDSIEIALGVA